MGRGRGQRAGLPWHDAAWCLDIADRIVNGDPLCQVAAELGVTISAISRGLDLRGLRDPEAEARDNAASVAKRLGISDTVFCRWIRKGYIRPPRRGQSAVYYFPEELLFAFLEDRHYWPIWEPSAIRDGGLRAWASDLRAAWRPELTVPQIAARYHVTGDTVHGWLRTGVLRGRLLGCRWYVRAEALDDFTPPVEKSAPRRHRAWTDRERRRLIRLRAEGLTFRQIGLDLSRHPEVVSVYYRSFRRGAVPLPAGTSLNDLVTEAQAQAIRGGRREAGARRRPQLTPAQRRRIYEDWQAGLFRDVEEAGRPFGVSGMTVRRIIEQFEQSPAADDAVA